MLEAILQLHLPWRRKAAILWIAFKSTALLGGRNIFVMAKPGAGVAGLIARMGFRPAVLAGLRVSDLRITGLRIFAWRISRLRSRDRLMLILRRPVRLRQNRSEQHQYCRHTTGDVSPPQHPRLSQSAF